MKPSVPLSGWGRQFREGVTEAGNSSFQRGLCDVVTLARKKKPDRPETLDGIAKSGVETLTHAAYFV